MQGVVQQQQIGDPVFQTLRSSDLVYPLPLPAKNDFTDLSSQTSFGFRRDGGRRKHGGVDLEAPAGTPVLAMADGIIRRKLREFYEGAGAIEVEHPGLGIVRYGEVDQDRFALLYEFARVKRGQVIAFVGKRKNATRAMLHLELYSNWHRNDLAVTDRLSDPSAGAYQRRSDLRNPTALLKSGLLVTGLNHVKLSRS